MYYEIAKYMAHCGVWRLEENVKILLQGDG